ncbi:MAG: bifunctional oligoribonuclease/PAP phosphatase NrnA [Planctomycetota bacterium]|nr:bifunctional oligoribonuclease/PAP phosphatase NrnA [Planctomycetota bacterium]
MKEYADAIRLLKENQTFWVTSHLLPDGDGLGSLLALTMSLRKVGKVVIPCNEAPYPRQLRFLPGFEEIAPERPETAPEVVVTMDVPVLDRLGKVKTWLPEGVPILNVDHHISNERFGKVNLVEVDRSATGEVVYLLLREAGFPLDADIATCLFTAIYTDTGRFSYSNTSPQTLEIAADLLRLGASVRQVSKWTYESRRPKDLELLSRAIANLASAHGGELAWTFLSKQDMAAAGAGPGDGQDIIDLPRSLEGVKIAVYFREDPDRVRVSMRSEGDLDVAAIAARFGGGGHRNAAGCTVEAPLEEAIRSVIDRASASLDA